MKSLKRDGTTQAFRLVKIVDAIEKAMVSVGNGDRTAAEAIAEKVVNQLAAIREKDSRYIPSIEGVQNMVEGYTDGEQIS